MEMIKDWSFKSIASDFDNHVREQLPWYDLVIEMISFIIRNVVPTDGVVYDIGSSTGNIKKILNDTIKERNLSYITIDNVPEMTPDIVADAVEFDYYKTDVFVLNLVLMFIPVKERGIFLEKLVDKLEIGGIIIIVDKFIQSEHYLSTILRRMTLYWKHINGVNSDEIIKKELSLSGIQIPLYKRDIEKFKPEQFFQFGEFSGFVITKQ